MVRRWLRWTASMQRTQLSHQRQGFASCLWLGSGNKSTVKVTLFLNQKQTQRWGCERWKAIVEGSGPWKYVGVPVRVVHSSPSWILLRWYELRRSSLEKTVALWRGSKAESVNEMGYLFFTVMSFSSHKSMPRWLYYLSSHQRKNSSNTRGTD